MMFSTIFEYAVKNILRNTFLSISSVLVLTLLMFFINILLVIHSVSSELIQSVNSKLTLSLYISEKFDKSSGEVATFLKNIKEFSPTIEAIYKTKSELLADVSRQDPELVRILERTNPLPDTIELSSIELDEYVALNTIIQNKAFLLAQDKNGKDSFADYNSQYERIEKIIRILGTLQKGLYIIIIVFLVSIAIIVYSVIGNFIYYFKDEIYITRLVGGDNFFVHGPFMLQWIIYALISFLFSTTLFYLLIKNIVYLFETSLQFSLLWNTFITLIWELCLFAFIGAVSWYMSSRRYLKTGK